ncbi:hypothetical protein [Nocardioides sp. W7]|uniref:hypothetical protein n=1 Tax=Nocardioides sp. W7 TaxID=2931390 RepID=UPI001FD51D11|nr:hypothetical protein [Nocardioides sp. W7]
MRVLVLALTAVLTALPILVAGPAEAHPFGPPQQVAVDADDAPGTVRVRWRVGGTDDLTLLGVSLGVLPPDRVMLDGAVFYEDADASALAASAAFRDYLLEHIEVAGDGSPCAGDVTADETLATEGVEVSFDCAEPVTTAAVSVTTLTDLHPAYRTMATGPAGQRAVYSADQPDHEWSLAGEPAGDAATSGTSAALQLGAALGVLLLAVLAGLVWFRRRGRRA